MIRYSDNKLVSDSERQKGNMYCIWMLHNILIMFVQKGWKLGFPISHSMGAGKYPSTTNKLQCAQPATDHVTCQRYISYMLYKFPKN